MEPFSKKKIAISFGGGSYNFNAAVNRICNELSNLNIFDSVIKYTEIDLKTDPIFWNNHGKFVSENKRGYGYYIWKPYIILKTLKTMDDGDILLYLDSGCEVMNNETSNEELNNLINKCNIYDILYTHSYQLEKKYTKMDLIKYMNIKNDDLNTNQHQTGVIFIKKTDKICKLIEYWYIVASYYHFIDDSKSIERNDSSFIEHRHDQSIFSLLTKKYSLNKAENILHNYKPIITSRRRCG